MIADIPNASVDQSRENVMMKIRDGIVDILVEISPEVLRYTKYIVLKKRVKKFFICLKHSMA